MSAPQRYFKDQLYRFVLAYNEDKAKLWEQDLPARYSDKEQYDNIDKDRKFKKKISNYITISREVQFEFAEIFTLFAAGVNEVIDDVEIEDDCEDFEPTIKAIATEHSEREDFSIVDFILSGGAEWVLDEETVLGASKDESNRIQSMFENELEGQSAELITLITVKFNHFTKCVAANAAKLFWRDAARMFNENVFLAVLDIMGCADSFLDEIQAAAPPKKVRAAAGAKAEADDDTDADGDGGDDTDADAAADTKKPAAKKPAAKKPAAKKAGAKAGAKKPAAKKAGAKAGAKKPAAKAGAKKPAAKAGAKAGAKKPGAKKPGAKAGAKKPAAKAGAKKPVDDATDAMDDAIDDAIDADDADDDADEVDGDDEDYDL